MYKISYDKIDSLLKRISETKNLFLPVTKAGETNYDIYVDGVEPAFNVLKTVKSAKDLFFPQSETLMKFKLQGFDIEVKDTRGEVAPFVLMGVRACDYKAFEVLDRVFLSDPVDTYYKAKRDAGIVVTMACGKPEESCFCKAFGIDAANPMGDVTTWIVDGDLYWRANTTKGEALTEEIKDVFASADDKAVQKAQSATRDIIAKLPYSDIDLSYFSESEMMDVFNRPEWNELSEACLACGTCTFVCPTCQCYDIREFKGNNGEIQRYRCWDSCMYSDFTQMAHGNNRTTQMQRYRQRFMHKLKYYPMNNDGIYSCVGCGRCVNKCPQRLNIIKVIKALGGKK